MKRTNLMIDEKILKEARALLGTRTYSEAVNIALEQAIRIEKIRNLENFFGTGVWEGDLNEMREKSQTKKNKK